MNLKGRMCVGMITSMEVRNVLLPATCVLAFAYILIYMIKPFVKKRFFSLVKSGEIHKIRKEIGVKECSVFMLASGETSWWAYDRQFRSCKKLPILPSDVCFQTGDKESVCAGTHLIVSGKEFEGVVIWRYELAANKWFKGPNMINPRCLFASATCGTCAFVAGGIGMENNLESLELS